MEIDDGKGLYSYQEWIYRRPYFDSPLEKASLRKTDVRIPCYRLELSLKNWILSPKS